MFDSILFWSYAVDFMWAVIALIVFGVYDYFGYNVVDHSEREKTAAYRVQQVFVKLLIFGALFTQISWQSASAFILGWWFWLADLVYYAICEIFNGFKRWFKHNWLPGKGSFNEVRFGKVLWSGWTLFGLLFNRGKNGRPMSYAMSMTQAMFGLVVMIVVVFLAR